MYNIIYNIYGKTHDQLEKFENIIQKYFQKKDIILDIPKDFPNCFKTTSIQKVFHQVDFAFNNGSNVIITGKKDVEKLNLLYIWQNIIIKNILIILKKKI